MSNALDQEMAMAFAKMPKSSALDKLNAARVKREGNALLFNLLYSTSQSEKIHRQLLKEALKGNTHKSTTYYVCQICGYSAVDEIPSNCPVCNTVQEKFSVED